MFLSISYPSSVKRMSYFVYPYLFLKVKADHFQCLICQSKTQRCSSLGYKTEKSITSPWKSPEKARILFISAITLMCNQLSKWSFLLVLVACSEWCFDGYKLNVVPLGFCWLCFYRRCMCRSSPSSGGFCWPRPPSCPLIFQDSSVLWLPRSASPCRTSSPKR